LLLFVWVDEGRIKVCERKGRFNQIYIAKNEAFRKGVFLMIPAPERDEKGDEKKCRTTRIARH
jgi:hypothetical protein